MTLTALITLNAVIGAVVVYGLVLLLGHGIRSDRVGIEAQVKPLPQRGEDRLAA
jgi:hypothetical protein